MKTTIALLVLALQGAPTTSLPIASPPGRGFDPERLARVSALVQSSVGDASYAGAAYLIVHKGEIVEQRTFGMADADKGVLLTQDAIFRIYSMSKIVTAVAALQLVEQGKLALSDPIARWIPELEKLRVCTGGTADAPTLVPAARPITVKMLLNHTAGFTYEFFQGSPVHELYQRANLWESTSLDEFVRKVAALPLLEQPGTTFRYSICDDVLGALVERVSGEKFDVYCQKHIFAPLGMIDTGFDVAPEKRGRIASIHTRGSDGKPHVTPPILGAYAEPGRGFASGGAGLFTTLSDYARFVQALLSDGKLGNARILGRKTLELARENSLGGLARETHEFSDSDGWSLLSGVRLDPARSGQLGSQGLWYWGGAASTSVFCDPKEQLFALLFMQHVPMDEFGLGQRFQTLVLAALE
jgi:CubicO group peptidase (beta-lactamase class C family)